MFTGRFHAVRIHSRIMVMAGACALPLMMGCPPQGEGYRKMGAKDDVKNETADEHHHDHGPNGGHIVELGDYHGEVVVGDGRVFTLYLLGADAKTPAPVADASAKLRAQVGAEQKEIPLTAAPLEGETDGKTSRFTAAADALPVEIIDVEDLKGDVVLVIAGKETVGAIAHDHDHPAEDPKPEPAK